MNPFSLFPTEGIANPPGCHVFERMLRRGATSSSQIMNSDSDFFSWAGASSGLCPHCPKEVVGEVSSSRTNFFSTKGGRQRKKRLPSYVHESLASPAVQTGVSCRRCSCFSRTPTADNGNRFARHPQDTASITLQAKHRKTLEDGKGGRSIFCI